MVVDFEQWLLNAMHASIQLAHVIGIIFSERLSISAMFLQVSNCFEIKALK